MSIFLGELLGTLLLILLGDGVVACVLLKDSKGSGGGWISITGGWAFAVAIAVYVCGWATGGHVNPAVTLGFAFSGRVAWSTVPYYLSGQFIGAFLGAILVYLTYYLHFPRTEQKDYKLMTFCTKPAIYAPKWNFLTEFVGTAVLLIGVLGIFDTHNGISAGIGPYLVGILIFAIGLSLGGPTGYAINPARDLGPRFAHFVLPIPGKGSSEWHYAWIPVCSPILGGIFGTFIYEIIVKKALTPL